MENININRPSFKDLSWLVTEEEYRADEAYSYSTISKFNKEGFDGLPKLFDKIDSPSLVFGSMVDTLSTGTTQEFNEKFVVADWPTISDSLTIVAKTLFNQYKDQYKSIEDIPEGILAKVGEECGYYANSKYSSFRVKQIKENCSEYYNLLFLTQDKTLIQSYDYLDALDCVNILKSNASTKNYFSPNNPFNNNVEKFYQLKFKGKYLNYNIRCMADLIIVDHVNKTVLPCDLKTSFKPEWKFFKSFIEWSYWIQAQLYWYIIRQVMDNSDFYKDYTLLDYNFIVISKNTKSPLIWTYTDTQVIVDMTYGKNNNYICRNFRNIIPELDYYLQAKPKYPIGIGEINDIKQWLNNE